MTDSVWIGSVVIGGELASGCVELAGFPELPVVPDAGREREDALADAAGLAVVRVVGGLVPVADPAERPEALALALAVGANGLRIEAGDELLELVAGESLVGAVVLPAAEQLAGAGALEHRRGDLAL